MPDMDAELRDKIIETHTLVKRIDKEQDEHKATVNARLRDVKATLQDHRDDVKERFEQHGKRITKAEHFHTRVVTYAAVVAVIGGVAIKGLWIGISRIFEGGA